MTNSHNLREGEMTQINWILPKKESKNIFFSHMKTPIEINTMSIGREFQKIKQLMFFQCFL